MDDEIRALLRHKAGEVSAHRVPPSLVRRARLRLMRNAMIVGVAVVVVLAGAFIGVETLRSSEPTRPIPPATTHSPRPSPRRMHITASPARPVVACTSAQLRAVGTLEGAAGSREGAIAVSNFSDKTCMLEGTPTIMLLDQDLHPITEGVSFSLPTSGVDADGTPAPSADVVLVAPGDAASVGLRWSNWCPQGRAAPLWRMEIPGGGSVDVMGLDATEPPPCNGPGQPATIEVGPFEPSG